MALDRILLSRFRNHDDSAIAGAAKFNLLVGGNGAGKTNVLEAISLLAPGRGLRRAALPDMSARDGDGGFAINATLMTGTHSATAGEIRLGTGISPARPGRRIVQVNGAEVPATQLGEWLSLGWLTPAMDRLFAEGAAARRRFLDRLVLALDPAHARHAALLDSALRERNRLLGEAEEPDPAWLGGIEAQLAEAGAAVAAARRALVDRLNLVLSQAGDEPFAVPLLAYAPGGPETRDALAAALRDGRRLDRAAGRTLTGPHRDELSVTLIAKDRPAADCSTGEQKAMLISIVLAHATLGDGRRPQVLLLDEVAAHLDPLRRDALFARLREGGAQVWMTGTERAPFAAIAGEAAVWRVTDGAVAPA